MVYLLEKLLGILFYVTSLLPSRTVQCRSPPRSNSFSRLFGSTSMGPRTSYDYLELTLLSTMFLPIIGKLGQPPLLYVPTYENEKKGSISNWNWKGCSLSSYSSIGLSP